MRLPKYKHCVKKKRFAQDGRRYRMRRNNFILFFQHSVLSAVYDSSPCDYMDSRLPSSPLSSNDIIRDVLGDWGKWQLRTTLLIYLSKIPSAWFMACIIFTAPFAQPGEYFCRGRNETSDPSVWISVAHPSVGHRSPAVDYCHVYANRVNSSSSPDTAIDEQTNDNVVACTEFEHRSHYDSLVTQFDLVCSRTVLIATTQFWHLFGVLTGGIIATTLLNQFDSFPIRALTHTHRRNEGF